MDEPSIEWCRTHLESARFCANATLPPIAYPDEAFYLVYGISVFTHISVEHQLLWLAELHRIIKPGGVLLLSLHGKMAWNGLAEEDLAILRQKGFLFKTSSKLKGIVPDWYHTAYHSQEYVMRSYSSLFTTLAYIEAGLGYQDLVILQR